MPVKTPLHPLQQLIIQKAVLPMEEAKGADPRLRRALPKEPMLARKRRDSPSVQCAEMVLRRCLNWR